MSRRTSFLTMAFLSLAAGAAAGGEGASNAELRFATYEESRTEYERTVGPFLRAHCQSCHGPKRAENELDLSSLSPDMKSTTSAARWATVLEMLTTGKMPPNDSPQPSKERATAVGAWLRAEMKRAGKHLARRVAYANGNAVGHEVLFGSDPPPSFDTPAGVRRISPEIYAAFAEDLGKNVPGIGQPFSPSGKTTFKDMGAPKLDEPVTAQLIRNALLIVEKRLTPHTMENGVARSEQRAPQQLVRLFNESPPPTDAEVDTAISFLFEQSLRRKPAEDERQRFRALLERNIRDAGREVGVRYTLVAALLLPESIFRSELGGGKVDDKGRLRLAPREIAFALCYALTDRRPDSWLLAEAEQGKLDTDEGVAAAVRRMLDEPKLAKPRILRFFREYFAYPLAIDVFKNAEENREHHPIELVAETDRLIEWILERDENVLKELLTTNRAFVNFRWDTNKKKGVRAREKGGDHVAYGLPADWEWTAEQPVELPADQRAGILTQPSWLVAWSKSDENHAILRGRWIRERLLGNVVPDIPITVDAQLPVAPEQTLRQRMAVTQEEYCWQCHRLMNDLGYPFEQYDHFGRFRTEEQVLDLEATARNTDKKGKSLGPVFRRVPVEAGGAVGSVGDVLLEKPVDGAVELLHHLARSERVEQVFVRHAFRYWLGRNETPGDAATLRRAHAAYTSNGGSMKALIAALLSSESFLYRVPSVAAPKPD